VLVETIEGLAAAASIYEKRNTIATMMRRVGLLLLQGNVQVAVFGEGGSGKSTLGAFLSGALDTDEGARSYKETITVENFGIAGSTPAKLIVPPGQEARRPGNWDQLFGLLSSGSASRIINLVSWGYLATELEKARVLPGKTVASDAELRHDYLSDGRDRELKALQQLIPHIRSASKPIHMITFVNKQDLWWNDRYEAVDYYKQGPYNGLIQEVLDYKGVQGFQHDIVSAALIQQNLRTGDGFEIASTAAGYDDALRVANLSRAALAIQQMVQS
jgi:ABC-type dipeptide/oligopeptide/nickel transport system ATPase component